ncbi:NADH-quinone oxidoreductase subunit C [Candidatus Bathyarchaeota archaeon]|nr:NADH-quinone oxidoreductase subunit C [Candidatus Bathyarchaeota archaeon]
MEERFNESVTYVEDAETTTLLMDRDIAVEVASALKEIGFNHFSDVTVVDYLEEEEFELIYHLWSHGSHARLMMKTRVPRGDAAVKSFTPIWRSAHMHERECHEMFGVDFIGHTELTPLLLEDWEGVPPLRKDFDSRKYVLEQFYGGERE